ncbi:MAG TPA: malate dehydrogenase (quinone) [Methylophilaceae bacterium]|nr:malate dehydrogenase (quinone) [Methylophilaceae bacterium]
MSESKVDVLLVGGGVMSATLGMMLMQLDPTLKVLMVERLDHVAHESTDGWNNAGTGHAGYCELNYTPQKSDGTVEIARALAINASFETSLQFWSYLVEQNILPAPEKFINATPHQSFVWGKADVAFLRKRHKLLSAHHLFKDMVFSEDPAQIREWMPLVMEQRDASEPVAATRIAYGSDVDFGTLTRSMVAALQQQANFELAVSHTVKSLKKQKSGRWHVRIQNMHTKGSRKIDAAFVFLGAGGGALPLLQKSGIPESKGYGGFPVSGQWLVCKDPEIVKQHDSKVYGKAALGSPPMSVPHLDMRIIGGQPALLFGPYAGFTTKFQKKGSFMDLISSVRTNNLKPIMLAGLSNMDLTRYLIGEVFQSHKERVKALSQFYPDAKESDWTLATAGQRVQIIKKCGQKGGKLEFGTEIVTAKDGSLATLLGASPGASTAAQAMIEVIEQCFGKRINTEEWQARMKAMVPSYGQSLIEDATLLDHIRCRTLMTLGLKQS